LEVLHQAKVNPLTPNVVIWVLDYNASCHDRVKPSFVIIDRVPRCENFSVLITNYRETAYCHGITAARQGD